MPNARPLAKLEVIATATADSLLEMPGIDGVVVILLRKDGDEYAGASRAPTIPFDGVFGASIKCLSTMRDDALRQIAEKKNV